MLQAVQSLQEFLRLPYVQVALRAVVSTDPRPRPHLAETSLHAEDAGVPQVRELVRELGHERLTSGPSRHVAMAAHAVHAAISDAATRDDAGAVAKGDATSATDIGIESTSPLDC